MSWSRRNSTLCSSSRALISANRPGSRAASARLTPSSSAPMFRVRGWTSIGVVSSDHEDGRAGGLAGLQVAVRLDRIGQLVPLVDLDPDASGGDVAEKFAGQ